MKRIHVAGVCVLVAVVIGIAVASASSGKAGFYGLFPTPSASATTRPPSPSSLLAMEKAALTSKGISPARASEAIDVQSQIAQTDVVSKVGAAMANTYGGSWFERATAQLHIGVPSPASRRTAEEVVAQAGLTANVTETPVRSTWAQLQAAQQQWDNRLARPFAHAEVRTALEPQHNSLSITLSSSVPKSELAALKREASTASVNVMVTVVPSSQLVVTPASMATVCNPFTKEAAYCNKTITSGVTIQDQPGPPCTAGPMAIPRASKNETYLLTAGHCIKPGGIGSKWYAFNRAGTKEEIGPVAEYVFNTKGDAAAIKIANPGYWVEANTKDPVFADSTEWSKNNPEMSYFVEGEQPPVPGTMNCHEGQTTGQTCGQITRLESVINYGTNGGIVGGLVEDTAGAAGGDSGGPWLFITTKANQEVKMEGIMSGTYTISKTSVYEPLETAYKLLTKLNLELLTTSNEVR